MTNIDSCILYVWGKDGGQRRVCVGRQRRERREGKRRVTEMERAQRGATVKIEIQEIG